jgi:hypothetical protein
MSPGRPGIPMPFIDVGHRAKVAQSVEHAPEKCGVAGSIPALGTTLRPVPENGAGRTFFKSATRR